METACGRPLTECLKTIEDFHGWKAALRTHKRPHKTVAEHNRIIEAIAAGDEKKARSFMRSHLLAARRNIGIS